LQKKTASTGGTWATICSNIVPPSASDEGAGFSHSRVGACRPAARISRRQPSKPLQRARIELGGGEGDAPAAALEQMARQGGRRIGLREANAVHAWRARRLHQMHARNAAATNQFAGRLAAFQSGHEQAGRTVQELLAQQLLLFAGVVVRDADQGLVARPSEGFLHAFEHVDEQRVRQHRDQEHHMRAVPRRQRAGRRIGHVAEAIGRRLDARTSPGSTARSPRSARDTVMGTDAGDAGHVGKRHPAGGTGSNGAGHAMTRRGVVWTLSG
jgi:hypothetical protein